MFRGESIFKVVRSAKAMCTSELIDTGRLVWRTKFQKGKDMEYKETGMKKYRITQCLKIREQKWENEK